MAEPHEHLLSKCRAWTHTALRSPRASVSSVSSWDPVNPGARRGRALAHTGLQGWALSSLLGPADPREGESSGSATEPASRLPQL